MAESAVGPSSGGSGRSLLLLGLAGLPILGLGYGILASFHPVVGSSFLGVVSVTLLFVTSLIVFFAQRNRDLLDPLRLVSAFFIIVYCINPLVGSELDWFFVDSIRDLVPKSGLFALFALVLITLGYHLPLFRAFPNEWTPREPAPPNFLLSAYALGLFGLGAAAYLVLFVRAGGIEGVIASEEHRMDFTRGIGWLLHASLFMFSGGALYFASRVHYGARRPWLAAWPLATAFLFFIVLQNRSRAFWAVAIFFIVWHYQVRPLQVRKLAPYAIAFGIFFVFIGFARNAAIRPLLLTNPAMVIQETYTHFGELVQGTLGFSLNRLQQLMLALDSYPERAPYEWGKTFVSILNPLFRFVGLGALQAAPLGGEFFRLAHPEAPLDVQNGYHPSLLGELVANFPWPIALVSASFYGIALRALYATLIVRRRDYASVALYSAVIYAAASMVIWGFGSVVFRIAVIALPILVVLPLIPHRHPSAPALPQAVPPGAKPGLPPRGGDPARSSAHR